jgi:hypothetical protein
MHETAVRRPPISREHAREIFAENRGGIHKPAAGPNRVDRGVGGGERPEPMQVPATFQPVSSGLTTGLSRTWAHSAL